MRIPLQILPLLALVVALPVYAENAPPAAPDHPAASADAPPASVGRIDFASGNVAIYQLGQTDWTRAEPGLSLTIGDWLATDPKARAAIRVGPASVDLANGTELSFANLQERSMELSVARGRIEVHLHQPPQGGAYQIDLPVGTVRLVEPGSYDISVGADGRPFRVAVFAGSARFAGGGLDQTIGAGNALVLNGAGSNRSAGVEPARLDEFARWSRARDERQQSVAAEQVAPAPGAAAGSTEAEEPAAREEASRAERHARAERHRRVFRHRYARYFRHRHYGYAGAAPGPAIPNPFSIIGSLLPFR